MRAGIVRWGVGLALLLAGAAATAWSALVQTSAPAQRDGPDHPVDARASDPRDISAQNSPTVVRNPRDPRQVVVANRIDTPDFSCRVHVSADGGARWRPLAVPIPAGEGRKCYAPDAAYGPDGTLHVSYVTLHGLGNTPRALWATSSRDGGRTLGPPRKVAGPLAFQARLAADPTAAGRLYATWVQAREVGNLKFTAPGNPILLSASGDGGATWSPPVQVSDPRRGRVLAPSAAVGPRGEVYVLYLDVGDDRLDYEGAHENEGGPPYPGRFTLVVARSLDRGRTWEESVVDDRVVPVERFIPFLAPFPSLAVDPRSGRLYVAFHDARLGDPDVWVWSLGSGDEQWTGPARVNDTPPRDGTWQYLPQLDVAPSGRLDVVYYDRRRDPRDVRNEVSLQSSFDDGRSFGAHATLSSRSFDSRVGFGSERGLATLGSRLGLASADAGVLAAWSDTRAGTQASNKQQVAAAVAVPARRGVAAATARSVGRAGFAVALGGLAALALAAWPSRR